MTTDNGFAFLQAASCSEAGLVRSNNEDAMLSLPAMGCFAVADGMGGGMAGEVASAIVTRHLQEAWEQTAGDSPGARKYAVQQSLHRANGDIVAYADGHHFDSMGSTVVLLQFDGWNPDRAYVCHVGDSPAFCFRGGELFRLTRDHSVGEELKTAQAAPLPERLAKALTRVVGGRRLLVPEWNCVSVCPGDVFLLCSDGVTTVLTDGQLTEILAAAASLDDLSAEISRRVLAGGAPDNFTLLCVKVAEQLPLPVPVEEWEREESDLLLKVSEERKDYGND